MAGSNCNRGLMNTGRRISQLTTAGRLLL